MAQGEENILWISSPNEGGGQKDDTFKFGAKKGHDSKNKGIKKRTEKTRGRGQIWKKNLNSSNQPTAQKPIRKSGVRTSKLEKKKKEGG